VTNDLWNQRVNQNERPQILNKDFTFLLLAGAVFFLAMNTPNPACTHLQNLEYY